MNFTFFRLKEIVYLRKVAIICTQIEGKTESIERTNLKYVSGNQALNKDGSCVACICLFYAVSSKDTELEWVIGDGGLEQFLSEFVAMF